MSSISGKRAIETEPWSVQTHWSAKVRDVIPHGTDSEAGPAAPDRRSAARIRFEGDTIVHIRSHVIQCRAVDVAEGGIRLRGRWWANPGEYARVRFRLAQRDVVALGRVAWRRRGEHGAEFGLSFLKVEDDHRHELLDYLGKQRPAVVEPAEQWDEPRTDGGRTWENPPTVELPGTDSAPSSVASNTDVLDTLPGTGADEVAESPDSGKPAPRPRVRHQVTMHDLWMLQVREWGRKIDKDE